MTINITPVSIFSEFNQHPLAGTYALLGNGTPLNWRVEFNGSSLSSLVPLETEVRFDLFAPGGSLIRTETRDATTGFGTNTATSDSYSSSFNLLDSDVTVVGEYRLVMTVRPAWPDL